MGSVCGRGSGERKDEREEKELSRVEGFNSRRSSNRFLIIYCLEHILLQYMTRRRSTLETGVVQLCFTNHEPTRKFRNWVTTHCFQVKKNHISFILRKDTISGGAGVKHCHNEFGEVFAQNSGPASSL